MLITKTIEIDMGHRVPNHTSKCRNIHGHRYKIEVGVDDKLITTPGSSDEGMVMDFGDLKQVMMDVIDTGFDHGFVVYEKDEMVDNFLEMTYEYYQKIIFVPFIPTVENLAKFWFGLVKDRLEERKIKIKHIKVWETPTSTSYYEGE